MNGFSDIGPLMKWGGWVGGKGMPLWVSPVSVTGSVLSYLILSIYMV